MRACVVQKKEPNQGPDSFKTVITGSMDHRHMPDIGVDSSIEIADTDFPDVYVLLAEISVALHGAIPALGHVCSVENKISPTVKDPHFKFVGIETEAFREEEIIDAVAIRCESIRHVDRYIRINADRHHCRINAAIGGGRCQNNVITSCASEGVDRVLQCRASMR